VSRPEDYRWCSYEGVGVEMNHGRHSEDQIIGIAQDNAANVAYRKEFLQITDRQIRGDETSDTH
jgi:hypothetical protein